MSAKPWPFKRFKREQDQSPLPKASTNFHFFVETPSPPAHKSARGLRGRFCISWWGETLSSQMRSCPRLVSATIERASLERFAAWLRDRPRCNRHGGLSAETHRVWKDTFVEPLPTRDRLDELK